MMLANLGGLYSAGKSELQSLINDLFGQGQQGLLFVPQPVVLNEQRLYKLDNFTDPVTADGDPVGGGKEVSGNGNHLTQSVSADRPTYNTDGSLNWLGFDGAGDHLQTADFGLPHLHSVSVAFYPTAINDFVLDGLAANSGSLWISNSTGDEDKVRASAGSVNFFSSNTVVYNEWNIATVIFDGASSIIRLNGVEVTGNTGTASPGGVTLGHNGGLGGGSSLAGRIAGAAVRPGRFTASQIEDIESYLNGLVGGGVL